MKKLFETVDVICIANTTMIDEHFFYFTQMHGMWEHSIALVFPNHVEVIAPPLEEGNAHVYHTKEEMEQFLKDLASCERIGFNGTRLPYKHFKYLKKIVGSTWIDVNSQLEALRVIKKPNERAAIKKACHMTQIIVNLVSLEGKREKDVAVEIEQSMRQIGVKPAFDTIVSFGSNTASPHHTPGNRRDAKPAFVDLGASYKGYASDITRSYVGYHGRRLYEIVEQALHLAVDEMRDGVFANEIYHVIENYLDSYGYHMRHALGHSIGIHVHDGFPLTKTADFQLRENMVFAVEPAVYLKRFGIRIEEDVIVGKKRATVIR